jgi:hypothetical protein
MTPRIHPPGRLRRGALLLETAAGGALLLIAFALVLRLTGWVAADRREADRREAAVSLAAGALERLAALPPESRRDRSEPVSAIDPDAARLLPNGRLDLLLDPPDELGLSRARVAVRWDGAPSPVRLTAWLSTGRATP